MVEGGYYRLYDLKMCLDPNCKCHTGEDKDKVLTPFLLDTGNPYCCARCGVGHILGKDWDMNPKDEGTYRNSSDKGKELS